MVPDDLYPRHAAAVVADALADTRVVVVNGARQTGKSTLARLALAGAGGRAYFLDDAGTRDAAHADPMGLVRHDGLLLIDEIQRVPDLLLAVKYEVDQDPRPGRFLLTGSARLLGLRDLPDALPRSTVRPTGSSMPRSGPVPSCGSGRPGCAGPTTSTAPCAAATPRRSAGWRTGGGPGSSGPICRT